jgi:hypothetical protein
LITKPDKPPKKPPKGGFLIYTRNVTLISTEMSSFENPSISPLKEKPKEKSKSEKLKQAALAAVALYALPPSDAPQPKRDAFDQRAVASAQLEKDGITIEQRKAYKPGVSEFLAHNVNPYGYSDGTAHSGGDSSSVSEDIVRVVSQTADTINGEKDSPVRVSKEKIAARHDAWQMYLGLPQEHNTFDISEYRPEHSSEDKYYYRINGFLKKFAEAKGYNQKEALIQLLGSVTTAEEREVPPNTNRYSAYDRSTGVMGFYTLTKGQDEKGHYISYYDRWDLEGSIEGKEGVIGKPFEIYDRIYYDPKTLE